MAKFKYDNKLKLLLSKDEIEKLVIRNAIAHGAIKINNHSDKNALIVTVDGKNMVLTPTLKLRAIPNKGNKNKGIKHQLISKI